VLDGGLEQEILLIAIDQDGLAAMTWDIRQVRKLFLLLELPALLVVVRAFARDMRPEQLASLNQEILHIAIDQGTHLVTV
jgi:DNA-binding GntR family transcriptional regulator